MANLPRFDPRWMLPPTRRGAKPRTSLTDERDSYRFCRANFARSSPTRSQGQASESKQRRRSASVERDSRRSSAGESTLADIDLWHPLIAQRHLGYAPDDLSLLTRTRATHWAS